MLYTLVIIAGLLDYAFTAPLSSCLTQADCIDASITELDETDDNDNVQYEICLIFDATLSECVKDEEDEISHACVAGPDGIVSEEDGEKLEGLSSGVDDALCDIVPCGTYTTFGLKDGPSCELDGEFLYANLSIPDYDEYLMCYSGMSCNANGRNSKACKWAIKAPDCDDTTTTTTGSPTTTTTTTEGTTTTGGSTTGTTRVYVSTTTTTTTDPPATTGGCQCTLDGEAAVGRDTCLSRCIYDGGCESFGENMCRSDTPGDNAAVYNRARITNDLVTVDDDGNTETNGDGSNGDGDGVTETNENSKSEFINLSIVAILSMLGLYL